jgi:hypothetical protein
MPLSRESSSVARRYESTHSYAVPQHPPFGTIAIPDAAHRRRHVSKHRDAGRRQRADYPGERALRAIDDLAAAVWQAGRIKPGPDRKSSKESDMSVYRVTEIIGTSGTSWEDAAAEAIRTAAGTLRDLRVAEVVKQDIHLDEGGGITYRTKLQLSFKYEPEH